jgi:hypothetical protein
LGNGQLARKICEKQEINLLHIQQKSPDSFAVRAFLIRVRLGKNPYKSAPHIKIKNKIPRAMRYHPKAVKP